MNERHRTCKRAWLLLSRGLLLIWLGLLLVSAGAWGGPAPPARYVLPLNLFILDDGLTPLAELSPDGGVDEGTADDPFAVVLAPAVRPPGENMRQMIESELIPAVSRIWAQCNVEFRLVNLAVVMPGRVQLSQGTLAERLFGPSAPSALGADLAPATSSTPSTDPSAGFEIRFDDRATLGGLGALIEATRVLAAKAGAGVGRADASLHPFDPLRTFTLFVTGARLITDEEDPRGFRGMTTIGGRVLVVHWEQESLYRNVWTVAHELGHGLGLGHASPGSDPANLMVADPDPRLFEGPDVSPEAGPPNPPGAILRPEQCDYVDPVAAHLSSFTPTPAE